MAEPGLHTLGRWLRDRALGTPRRVAIDYDGRLTTYAELDRRAEARAAHLLALGLRPGERVATLTGNSPEHVEVLFGCAKAGLMLLPLNWRLAPAELTYQIDDAEPAVLLVEDCHADLAAGVLAQATSSPHVMSLRPLPADLPASPGIDMAVSDEDGLLLMYTSGTTGRPKGAVLTHANCFWTNLSLDRTAGIARGDVVLQVLPQFHVGGWNVQPLLAWWKGATVVLERSFDAARALRLLQDKRVTTMMGVPATYLFLAEQPGFAGADLSSLQQAVVGGAPMPEALLRRWRERGVAIVQGYGLTEAAPNVLCLPAEDAVRKLGYAGKPYPHVDVALADPHTGAAISGTGEGELLVRGPNVFPGYWHDKAATGGVLRDGWLHTGDIARRDEEGFYEIRDRLKDMYISGGENVYPAEVEAVLHEHAGVADAAVIGVPDERWGEVGLAVVVAREGSEVSDVDLLAHCRARLAGFKVPRAVRFVDALPRSGVDKILKTRLRDRFTGEGR
jgi:fatty-acyl-CoA synthase